MFKKIITAILSFLVFDFGKDSYAEQIVIEVSERRRIR